MAGICGEFSVVSDTESLPGNKAGKVLERFISNMDWVSFPPQTNFKEEIVLPERLNVEVNPTNFPSPTYLCCALGGAEQSTIRARPLQNPLLRRCLRK